ncbi:MAG: hypothetical protein WBD50_01160 [Candidatus Rhabdochlamydia sp.]
MSISPVTSPLPELSAANFSSFSDIDENQELTLKDRIKLVIDRLGYKVYSSFNRPLILTPRFAEVLYRAKKEKFFAEKPQSYEEARARVLSYTHVNIGTWGPDLERKNVDLYADPEFRKERVKAYADSLFDNTAELFEDRKEEHWLIMKFCEEELHDLYRREPKYLRQYIPYDLRMIKSYNKPILAEHKKEWDQLSPSEKTEKIFGKRWKYEIVAGLSTAASCFFLCHHILHYQQLQLQSPRQPSTF